MNPVSDSFLLELAGITASLLGFFVVGVFFYVQRGLFPRVASVAQSYMQAATRTVIVLYGMALSMSLGLVAFEPAWAALLYLSVSIILLWSVVQTSLAIGRLHRALELRVMPQVPMWLAAAASVAAPWILGGTNPSREQLTAAILLLGVLAFASSASLVLSTFDISRLESSAVLASESGVPSDLAGGIGDVGLRSESLMAGAGIGTRKEQRMRNEKDQFESVERPLKRFGWRLDSILGERRIPRGEKRAKAQEAVQAVDELVAEIETGLSIRTEED